MLNSFKMTAGQRTFKIVLIYSALPTVLNIVFGTILKHIQNGHLRDFVAGFAFSSAGMILEVVVMMSVCIVFNSNNAAMPGYRFFHSVSGGAERFKRGLIFANLLSLAAAALYTISGLLFLPLKEYIILMAVTVVFALGWVNLFGSRGKMILLLIPVFALGVFFTLIAVLMFTAAVSAIFYIISAVYVIKNAKKIWEREM